MRHEVLGADVELPPLGAAALSMPLPLDLPRASHFRHESKFGRTGGAEAS